jgi:hypothetical protein
MAALAGLGATSGGAAAGDAGAGAWAHCHLLASSLPAAPGSQNTSEAQRMRVSYDATHEFL